MRLSSPQLLTLILYRWVGHNREFLQARQSPLDFHLHRARYLHFLIECHPPDVTLAIAYAKANFGRFYSQHESEIMRLMACIVYLPLARLRVSPYADLASPNLYTDIDPMFSREYCASLGMSRQIPLKVVADIGGGGALARIEKGRKLMRERKSEWSQADELPVRPLNPTSLSFRQRSHRSKYHCRPKTGTTQYLLVPSPRSNRRSKTLQ